MQNRYKRGARMGNLQRDALLWIGCASGVGSYSNEVWIELREWRETSRELFFKNVLQHVTLEHLELTLAGSYETLELQFAKLARAEASKNIDWATDKERIEDLINDRPRIRWASEKFLGRSPSRSEATKLAIILRKLDEQGWISREDGTRGEGAKARTRFVRLSRDGQNYCVKRWVMLEKLCGAEIYTVLPRKSKQEELNCILRTNPKILERITGSLGEMISTAVKRRPVVVQIAPYGKESPTSTGELSLRQP